jgi:nicotinamidase/pyrazinamidase
MHALALIDIQNDFLPGGALGVPRGNEILPVVDLLVPHFPLVLATQDWHPPEHGSFAANHPGRRPGEIIDLEGLPQILWPVHCVQGSPGARLVEALDASRIERVFRKGSDPAVDSYSGFHDNGRRHATGLRAFLQERGVRVLHLAGLATDYCVRYTALDARELGFETVLHVDACRGVELVAGDVARALDALQAAGVRLVTGVDPGGWVS